MSLWRRLATEAHRRSLWQVLGVYVIAGWIGYQVILALYEGLALPEWVPPFAIVLFIVGLPIVLATAMVQEGGPTREARAPGRDLDPTLHPEIDTTLFGDVTRQPTPLKRHLTWRRSLGAGIAAFTLLAVSAAGVVVVRTRSTLVAQGVLDERGLVVLADFATRNTDAEIGGVITEALRIDLQQSNILRLADAAQINATLERMHRAATDDLPVDVAREVAEREGWKAVIAGEIGLIGGSYVLTVQLVTPDSARVLASFKSTAADSTKLLGAVDNLSKQVRAKIGEQLATVRAAPPLERVSTSSLAALRKFAEATRTYDRTGDQLRAVELLEQAIALDSSFASAWRRHAMFLRNLAVRPADRDTSITRAYALRDRLSNVEALLAEAGYEQIIRRNVPAAIDAYRQVLQIDPDQAVALNNLAVSLLNEGRVEEAVAPLEHAVEAGVWNQFVFTNLISVQFRVGRVDAAHATLERARAALPENLSVEGSATNLAASTGNWSLADSLARGRSARAGTNALARVAALGDRAQIAQVQGHAGEGLRLWRDREREFAAAGEVTRNQRRGAVASAIDVVIYTLGDTARALRELDAAVRAFPPESSPVGAGGYFLWAERYAAIGRFDRADELVKRSLARADSAGTTVDSSGRTRARIALYRGDPVPVLQTHDRLADAGNCKICDLPWLGQAFELAGHADSARIAYEQFITTPQYGRLGSDADWRALVLLRSAGLHEASGDTARAIERYTEFVQLWQNADAVLQPRVEAVKARIARLRGPG